MGDHMDVTKSIYQFQQTSTKHNIKMNEKNLGFLEQYP